MREADRRCKHILMDRDLGDLGRDGARRRPGPLAAPRLGVEPRGAMQAGPGGSPRRRRHGTSDLPGDRLRGARRGPAASLGTPQRSWRSTSLERLDGAEGRRAWVARPPPSSLGMPASSPRTRWPPRLSQGRSARHHRATPLRPSPNGPGSKEWQTLIGREST